MEKFIELNRTFSEQSISPEINYIDDDRITKSYNKSESKTWEEILGEYRVILLAEAGAGKTLEIQQATNKLRAEKKNAFFLRLEHIADDLESAFEIGKYDEFQAWLASKEEGWFLLDSVDEARLKDPRDFDKAIRKLAKIIDTASQRTHIIITSRVSAWRPNSDLVLCQTLLRFNNSEKENLSEVDLNSSKSEIIKKKKNVVKETSNESSFKIYKLDDLTKNQIKIFAFSKGVENITTFLEDIERQDAWMFTTRPQDLEDIIVYWNENGKIGSQLELIKHNVDRKLVEREQNRATIEKLSSNKMIECVETLAAASSFMNKSIFKIPDGTHNTKGIDLKLVLPDLKTEEYQEILSRPIFDEAIYGTVRFHHRSVREYLTAKWICGKLDQKTSRKQIENLFFQKKYGVDVLVPSMKPILSWLTLFDYKIRQRTFKLEPEIILEGGDPSILEVEDRRNILHAVCENISMGQFSRAFRNNVPVRRFSSHELSDDIRDLLNKYNENDRVIDYLLSLIWEGNLKELVLESKALALSSKTQKYNRRDAIYIVKALGSKEDFNELLVSFQSEEKVHSRSILTAIIENIDSTDESVDWILSMISKVEKKKRNDHDELVSVLNLFINRSNTNIVFRLIKGINILLHQKPFVEKHDCQISQVHGWLIQVSIKCIEKLILNKDSKALSSEVLFVLVQLSTLHFYRDFGVLNLQNEVINAMHEWDELNHRLFWYNVEDSRKSLLKNEKPLTSIFQISRRSYWSFNGKHFDLILSDIKLRPLEDDRLVALSLAFLLYKDAKRPKEWLKQLKKNVSSIETLNKHLSGLLNPPPMSMETRRYNQQEANWKRQQKERQEKKKKQHLKNVEFLNSNLPKLREGLDNGQIISCQSFLYNVMHGKNKNSASRYSIGNWHDLIEDYGDNVAIAFREGLIKFWRSFTPVLLSELESIEERKNSTPWGIVIGLAGIEMEFSDGIEKLTKAEAQIACKYAFNELNSFPNWFYQLYTKFPNEIFDLVCQEIKWEFESGESKPYILAKIIWSAEWLHDKLSPQLLSFLDKEPLNIDNLGYALKIIQKNNTVSDEMLAAISMRKVKELSDAPNRTLWLSCWIGVDPDNAIPFLVSYLEELNSKDSEEAKNAAMRILVDLVGERTTNSNVRGNYKTADFLKQLFILMHRYIKVQDDIERAGMGVYSPELRDDAQEARNRLFSMLSEIPGKESYLAMIELADLNLVPSQQLWMKKKAKDRAEIDSENKDWNESKFAEFNIALERSPSNNRDLFDLAVQRLDDLKYWLEDSDDSLASILINEKLETKFRNYIANWCNEKASGKYFVTQEEERTDKKRTDCRFVSSNFNAPVPIEIKIADKWSGNELFERLENQLNNDYLRDPNSNHGIFLLVYRGERKSWEVSNRNRNVNFLELIEAIQDYWNSIQHKYAKVEQIKVIGIDLLKRSIEIRLDNPKVKTLTESNP
ncbi:MAG: NACHT domain-containing protein [Bacteroidota bacterium]